ncbi:MAG: DUF4214 domain-containing protein [Acidimicrobiales bacterium]|nr:DUF4214 domain-containing protein [Acidimicrobiales bacterium]
MRRHLHGRERGRARRLVTAGLATAGLSASMAVLASAPPARAADAPIDFARPGSLTWVDAQGRQVTVAQELAPLEPRQPVWDLVVLRDTVTGQPDPTWTDDAGVPGRRTVVLDPPADGARLADVMAAAGDGTITIVWNDGACEQSEACTRWFQAVDTAGTTLSGPMERADAGEPLAALPDGSVLAGTATGPLEWRARDGSATVLPFPASQEPSAATVDGDGRLLLARFDGTVVRIGALGDIDLEVDAGCAAGTMAAIGPDGSGDGFATACAAAGIAPRVARWAGSGTAIWATEDTVAPGSATELADVTRVAGDGTGKVWVAGHGAPGATQTQRTIIASFTAAGPEAPAYDSLAGRPVLPAPNAISDLRPVLGDRVAFSHDDLCCTSIAGRLPFDRVVSGVLPDRPSPPTCRPGPPSVSTAAFATATIAIRTCDVARDVERPTSYLVEVSGDGWTATATVAHSGDAVDVEVPVSGLVGGELLRTRVLAQNAEGPSLGGWQPGASLVVPFATVEAFTFRMFNTLTRSASWDDDGAALVAEVESGSTSPAELVADMLGSGPAATRVEPVARLYLAILGRTPDAGGLRYWVGRSEAGVRLATIAERMAASSEFHRRYGALTDRGFVEQLYRNVLGREGDAAGIDYWYRRLAARRITRGGVVTQFSQSSEMVRRSAPTIQPLAAAFLLLHRVPTNAEHAAWATATPRLTAATAILASAELAAEVSA